MSERNYYVLCDDNCRFESMTKEQIIAAIAEATGHTPEDIDAAFITRIKEQNKNMIIMDAYLQKIIKVKKMMITVH